MFAKKAKSMENECSTKKTVKILRIIARLNIGGPAMQAIFLNAVFNKGNFMSTLVYGSIDDGEGDMGYLLNSSESSSVYIKELGRKINFFKDIASFFKILSIMLRYRPHIVHTHTAKAGAIGRLAAICAGVPVKVHTLHGHIFDGYFDNKKTGFFKAIESFLAHFTDRIIVLSPALQGEISDKLKINDKSKFSIIPLGVDADIFLNSDSLKGYFRKELHLSDKAKLIGIIGRLAPIKNHRMFIDAARLVLKNDNGKNDIRFIVVGDGELRQDLMDYAEKLGISNNFIFTGWRRDLDKIYADLDVVSLCSINEGTPVSLIEAMLAAKPVVATGVGGVRDLISHSKNGYVVESGNTERFAEYILDLVNNMDLARGIGRAARENAKANHTRQRLADDLEKLYRDILKRKGIIE